MAITTTNGKLAIMELGDVWEPGLPMSPSTLGTDDQKQLIWGFPEFTWSPPVLPTGPAGRIIQVTVYVPGGSQLIVYVPGVSKAEVLS